MSRNETFRIAVRKFPPFESAIRKIWAEFERRYAPGLRLEAVPMDLEPLHEALFESGGLRNGAWDVTQIITDWLAEAYEAKALENLKPWLERNPPEDYPEGWVPSLLGLQDFGDAVIGLPYHDGPEMLIWRRDLFEDPAEREAFRARYGRELSVPQTWEEFVDAARFFHRPERNLYGTVFAAYPDGHNTVYDFALQTWTHGGELVDESGRVVLASEGARRGMEFYRSMLKDASAVHPRSRDFDSVKSGLAFAAGEVALMVNWFGFAAMCEFIAESKVKGKVDIAPVPHAPGAPLVSLNCYWLYGIAGGSPHKEVAWEFLRFAVSRESDLLLTREGAIGCRKSTWRDEGINRSVPYYWRLEEVHRYARTLPRRADWARIAHVIDQVVLETINTDRPIEEILREGQARLG